MGRWGRYSKRRPPPPPAHTPPPPPPPRAPPPPPAAPTWNGAIATRSEGVPGSLGPEPRLKKWNRKAKIEAQSETQPLLSSAAQKAEEFARVSADSTMGSGICTVAGEAAAPPAAASAVVEYWKEPQPAAHVPDFDESARGSPKDWNESCPVFIWNKRNAAKVPDYVSPRTNIDDILEFFAKRQGPNGQPIVDRLAHPTQQKDGWYRCEVLRDRISGIGNETVEDLEWKGWVRAWHGSKLEAVYSILYQGRLVESHDPTRGDRTLEGCPGVYLHKDGLAHKADWYSRWSPVFGNGVFCSVKWEVRADRHDNVKVKQKTGPWVNRARSIRLIALWVCLKTKDQMEPGDEVSAVWDPLMEANPRSRVWTSLPQELALAGERRAMTLADWLPDPPARQRAQGTSAVDASEDAASAAQQAAQQDAAQQAAAAQAVAGQAAAAVMAQYDPHVEQLTAMGFEPEQARQAIAATGGNVEAAADWLLS